MTRAGELSGTDGGDGRRSSPARAQRQVRIAPPLRSCEAEETGMEPYEKTVVPSLTAGFGSRAMIFRMSSSTSMGSWVESIW